MRKLLLFCLTAGILASCFTEKKGLREEEEEKKDKYDNAFRLGQEEAEKMKDPALGYVPYNRLAQALEYTERLKQETPLQRGYLPLSWEERGPIYDSVGPSNGNGRGGGTGSTAGGSTSGRIRAFLLDTLNDPSGNTAFTGGVAGGVWRCTNFLDQFPNWTSVNDNFSNLAISSFAQDPTNPQTIYVATGEATSNADATYGDGVYKSTNGGLTFNKLPSTSNFLRNYKIGCDAAGNVYLACRITVLPIAQSQGLFRSTNGGNTWTDITPSDLTTAGNNTCTDFEFTASGNLNATFGYLAANNMVNQRYTTNPTTVTPGTWSAGAGFRASAGAIRTKLAVLGETLYAITINTAYNTDSCWRSDDGGATWTKKNTAILPAGLGSGQGWYNIAMAINPTNSDILIAGGLDAYRSTNGGATWTKFTNWVSTMPYVHADHHFHMYWVTGGQTRMIMACDGGLFYSNDNGATFKDKNRNLGIKQFYAGAIHPTAGSPYLIAGAQDNGTHQLKNPGLSYSIEVTGGDGCIVHINQQNPLIQFGSYVYNQYRRTTNGGATWSSVNLSSTQGLFVNPFDYDDAQNIMYCSNGPLSQIRRWPNANTASASTVLQFSTATLGATTISLTALKMSPYNANRVFFGTNNGRVFRLENANTVTNANIDANTTQISSAAFPVGTINCVNVGTDDNNIIATYTNYGVSSVWLTSDGGTNWTPIEGNLPDMPVRWAMFEPGDNNKIYLGTEAGIYTTTKVNGMSTEWLPEPGFPAVKTNMLKMRASDSTIVAATHGRGLWTAKIPPCNTNTINAQPSNQAVCPGATATFSVGINGPTTLYQWQVSTDGGATFTDIAGATSANYTTPATTPSMNGYRYRCIVDTYCSGLLTSGNGTLTVNSVPVITTCTPNITVNNTTNQCGANVTYAATVASGSPAPVITYSQASGSFFPVGTTTVTATATNSCGATTCTFTVTVKDVQAPVITCPANILATTPIGSCTAAVNYPAVTATDNCPGVTITRTAGPASGGTFPLGTTTVTHKATDAAGSSVTCSFTVTVNDGQLPIITQQPTNQTVCSGTNATFSVTATNAQSYQWQAWDGSSWVNISGANASTYTISNAIRTQNTNSYRVNIIGLCTTVTSTHASLYVNPLPTVKLRTSIAPSLTPTQTLTITADASPAGGSYVWYLNGALMNGVSGSTLSGLAVDNAGVYKVVYTDPNGCVNTSDNLTVTAQKSDGLWIYPVPNNGQFQVRFYNQPGEKATVQVFDAKGAKVYEKGFVTVLAYSRLDISLPGIKTSGTYFVNVLDQNGKRIAARGIVVKP
ncbi:MAG: HYR domain-containing protein [Bacteroidetes bacterium]|nr:HYR domain-containing protein [Bacteroidota bacterium]